MIDRARRQAERVLNVLEPQARMGIPIVFLEPSDWSAVVDDYASLLPDDRRLPSVAKHCYTFEQYLVHLFDHGELALSYHGEPKQVLLHGHCHQKALSGTRGQYTCFVAAARLSSNRDRQHLLRHGGGVWLRG